MRPLFFLLLLFITSALYAQRQVLIYSENFDYVDAEINQGKLIDRGDNYILIQYGQQTQTRIKAGSLNKKSLEKLIDLKKDSICVYGVEQSANEFNLMFRGVYKDLYETAFLFQRKNTKSQRLVQLAGVVNLSKSKFDNEDLKKLNAALRLDKYNCKQLEFIFKKIENDQDKLKLFENTYFNLKDIENYKIPLGQIKDQVVIEAFTELAKNQL